MLTPRLEPELPPDGTIMTIREYFQTPETNRSTELVYGVFRVAESPTVTHQRIVRDVAFALQSHAHEHDLGEVLFAPMDVVLDAARALVLQPDILFVASARLKVISDKVYGAPDLVVEVVSPMPRVARLDERLECFAAYGVRECWLLQETRRTVEVVTFENGRMAMRRFIHRGEPMQSSVLPNFTPGFFTWLSW